MNGNTHVCISAGIMDERVPLFFFVLERMRFNKTGAGGIIGKAKQWEKLICGVRSANQSISVGV